MHWEKQDDAEKKQMAELLDAFRLTQHADGPTHTGGHTLDLVMPGVRMTLLLSALSVTLFPITTPSS